MNLPSKPTIATSHPPSPLPTEKVQVTSHRSPEKAKNRAQAFPLQPLPPSFGPKQLEKEVLSPFSPFLLRTPPC